MIWIEFAVSALVTAATYGARRHTPPRRAAVSHSRKRVPGKPGTPNKRNRAAERCPVSLYHSLV